MFPAVIPVAGWGTRSLPASKSIPKEMLCVCNKPVIQYVVEEAAQAGVKRIIFVNSKGKSSIEDHFDRHPELESFLKKKSKPDLLKEIQALSTLIEVHSVRQKEALGLGHAVGVAASMISESHFFVLLGDEITDASPSGIQQLLNTRKVLGAEAESAGVVMVTKVSDAEVSKYGICELQAGEKSKVSRCIEKPKASDTSSRWAITGRYLLPRDVFERIVKLGKGSIGEIQLTDALDALAKEGRLYICEFVGKRLDAGDALGFLEANIYFYLKSDLKDKVKNLLKEYSK
ncbi:MAG: UTP--glucose-1-phosphate uridylyltransferase [Deltaproteobacteria bacterium CG11_big_fil_rev_8_21_14_0_20_45_16]|nr:MAG: UTP--glucose-1-phosphate uridylyltransferase [Deltaproteobacteria bacterium CG11_big_fil_rev_8_21_14_0_20_45_16]